MHHQPLSVKFPLPSIRTAFVMLGGYGAWGFFRHGLSRCAVLGTEVMPRASLRRFDIAGQSLGDKPGE